LTPPAKSSCPPGSDGLLIILKQPLCISSKGLLVTIDREDKLRLQLVLLGATHEMALSMQQLFAILLKE